MAKFKNGELLKLKPDDYRPTYQPGKITNAEVRRSIVGEPPYKCVYEERGDVYPEILSGPNFEFLNTGWHEDRFELYRIETPNERNKRLLRESE